MKVYYLNDTKECQMVHKEDCSGENMVYLAPQESHEFEIPTKEDDGVFVKQWNGRILIGRIDANAFKDSKRRTPNFAVDGETCWNCGCRSKTTCK